MPTPLLTLKEKKIIEVGVKNLKQFGYPAVNKDNILTDQIYSQFFLGVLVPFEYGGYNPRPDGGAL